MLPTKAEEVYMLTQRTTFTKGNDTSSFFAEWGKEERGGNLSFPYFHPPSPHSPTSECHYMVHLHHNISRNYNQVYKALGLIHNQMSFALVGAESEPSATC